LAKDLSEAASRRGFVSMAIDLSEQRRRTILSALLLMVVLGGGALDAAYERVGAWRGVDIVKVSGIIALAIVLALRSTTAIRLTPRNRELDDELSRANRQSAAAWGFWGLMLALLGAFVFSFYGPVSLTRIAPFLLVAGAASAGIRFVFLERRGARG
jgi:hypothetical protein